MPAEPAPAWHGPKIRPLKPVLLVAAVFTRHLEALAWAKEKLELAYGPTALISNAFSFHHTEYYQATMGAELRKQFFTFERLVPEDCLPDIKHHTNRLEVELAQENRFPEARPLNIDPGLLTLGKFLLASTKDQGHRIYLRDRIYAEVTLRYQAGTFEPWPWTYADYREPALHEFLLQARDYYRKRLVELEVES